MRTEVFYTFLISILAIACSEPVEKKCSQLKRGNFYYKSTASYGGSSIERNDSMQVVTDKRTGEKLKQKIEWIGPCTYLLRLLPDNKKDIVNSGLFPIKVTILEVTKGYYTVHVSGMDSNTDFNDTAWIAELK